MARKRFYTKVAFKHQHQQLALKELSEKLGMTVGDTIFLLVCEKNRQMDFERKTKAGLLKKQYEKVYGSKN